MFVQTQMLLGEVYVAETRNMAKLHREANFPVHPIRVANKPLKIGDAGQLDCQVVASMELEGDERRARSLDLEDRHEAAHGFASVQGQELEPLAGVEQLVDVRVSEAEVMQGETGEPTERDWACAEEGHEAWPEQAALPRADGAVARLRPRGELPSLCRALGDGVADGVQQVRVAGQVE
jgi:hypothetical protein